MIAALAAGGLAPAAPDGIDRAELRELARRGVLVERDGLWLHAAPSAAPAAVAAGCCDDRPDGFTVGEFREAAGITRKHAVPLLAELDARGVTRRRATCASPATACRPSLGADSREHAGGSGSGRRTRAAGGARPG